MWQTGVRALCDRHTVVDDADERTHDLQELHGLLALAARQFLEAHAVLAHALHLAQHAQHARVAPAVVPEHLHRVLLVELQPAARLVERVARHEACLPHRATAWSMWLRLGACGCRRSGHT